MTEKKQEDKGSAKEVRLRSELTRLPPDPEIVPARSEIDPKEMGRRVIVENLQLLLNCLLYNIKDKHLPSASLLFAIADYLLGKGSLSQEDCESFAKMLFEEYTRQRETGSMDAIESGNAAPSDAPLADSR